MSYLSDTRIPLHLRMEASNAALALLEATLWHERTLQFFPPAQGTIERALRDLADALAVSEATRKALLDFVSQA